MVNSKKFSTQVSVVNKSTGRLEFSRYAGEDFDWDYFSRFSEMMLSLVPNSKVVIEVDVC